LAFPGISFRNGFGGSYRGFGNSRIFRQQQRKWITCWHSFLAKGKHSLRLGAEFRTITQFVRNEANSHGLSLNFSQQYTNGPTNSDPGQPTGENSSRSFWGAQWGSLAITDGSIFAATGMVSSA